MNVVATSFSVPSLSVAIVVAPLLKATLPLMKTLSLMVRSR